MSIVSFHAVVHAELNNQDLPSLIVHMKGVHIWLP